MGVSDEIRLGPRAPRAMAVNERIAVDPVLEGQQNAAVGDRPVGVGRFQRRLVRLERHGVEDGGAKGGCRGFP
jgi:hypothetical protein